MLLCRNPLFTSLQVLLAAVQLIGLVCGCSSSSENGGPADQAPMISGVQNDSPLSFTIVDVFGEKTGFNGVHVYASTDLRGAQDPSVGDEEKQIHIKLYDIAEVTLDTPISVVDQNVFAEYHDGATRFLATSGTLTVSAIGNASGDAFALTFSIGWITTSSQNTQTAELAGELSTTIE
jgi:hypothetical protein